MIAATDVTTEFGSGTITAEAGERFLDLTGFASRNPANYGQVSQVIEKLEPGADYELSFYLGTSKLFPPHPVGSNTAVYRVTVDITGVMNGHRPFETGAATQVSPWDHITMWVHATGPSGTITFSGDGSADSGGLNGGDYLGIDNVSLRKLCFIFDVGCWL